MPRVSAGVIQEAFLVSAQGQNGALPHMGDVTGGSWCEIISYPQPDTWVSEATPEHSKSDRSGPQPSLGSASHTPSGPEVGVTAA